MPSPDGCYVRVWDRPGFTGASDFINGPRRYDQLRDLPGDRAWKNRIKSLDLGPTAAAVVSSEEGFRGKSALLLAESGKEGKFASLPVPIQSLDIRCPLPPSARSTRSDVPSDQGR